MTRRGKLPVEPLSGSAWQRIRAETFAELDLGVEPDTNVANRGRRRMVVGSVLAAALACGVVLMIISRHEPEGARSTTTRIEATNAFTRTTVGDVALEATAGSTLVATGTEAIGWTVLLERGKVSFSVPKRGDRPAFSVQAASVAVEVLGTRFTVARDGEHVRVDVSEGSVRVWSDGRVRLLVAGQHWENAEPPKPAPADAHNTAGVASEPAKATDSAPPTALRAQAPSRPRLVTPAREPQAIPSATPAIAASDSPRTRYETASRLEATDPNSALSIYSELSRGTGPWAANALYAAGRLELEQGREAQSRRTLEQYVRRFPNGNNIEEARKLLGRFH